jgi:dTDP-4-dehydrorhamnose reductase
MRVAITGTTGQLGGRLLTSASLKVARDLTLIDCGRHRMDLGDSSSIPEALDDLKPDVVLSCAAYTAVDAAEDHGDLAFQVNGVAPGLLGKACAERGIRVVHISTDYVFDGRGQSPYQPNDPTGPTGVYGASKLQGEQSLLEALPSASIVRVGWLYDREGRNFLNTMLRLGAEREVLTVVNDQWGCPTHVGDFAEDLLHWIRRGAKDDAAVAGIHHYGHVGITTWHGFASAILHRVHPHVRVDPVSSGAFPTRAQRPAYSKLDERSFFDRLGRRPISWEVALNRCLDAKFAETHPL